MSEEEEETQQLMEEYNLTHEEAQQFQKNMELWYAADGGDKQAVEIALSKGVDINFKHPDLWGDTPLHTAASEGHKDVMELLVMKGANPNITNTYHWTPLHEAYLQKKEDIIELLVSYGGDLQQVKKVKLLHC